MSLRKAINEKCKDCIYDPLSGLGNWRQQVAGCTSEDCSLWPVRPISSLKNGQKRAFPAVTHAASRGSSGVANESA